MVDVYQRRSDRKWRSLLRVVLFFAESPVAEKWTPHLLNPIFVDASFARNGGLVWDGQSVFRVSQGQTFDFYGKRTRINQIVELTERDYVEVCIGEITPKFARGVLGTHHLHSNGKVTVFDFVTLSRVPRRPSLLAKIIRPVSVPVARRRRDAGRPGSPQVEKANDANIASDAGRTRGV